MALRKASDQGRRRIQQLEHDNVLQKTLLAQKAGEMAHVQRRLRELGKQQLQAQQLSQKGRRGAPMARRSCPVSGV